MRKNKKKKGNKEQLRLLCRKWQEFVSFFFRRLLVQTREMPGARSCTTGHHRFMRLSAALVMSKHNSLTHAHTDTHSDTDTGQTHNTRDSDSLIFLYLFFFVLFSQSAASHRFWLFGLVFRAKDEGGGPLNGQ